MKQRLEQLQSHVDTHIVPNLFMSPKDRDALKAQLQKIKDQKTDDFTKFILIIDTLLEHGAEQEVARATELVTTDDIVYAQLCRLLPNNRPELQLSETQEQLVVAYNAIGQPTYTTAQANTEIIDAVYRSTALNQTTKSKALALYRGHHVHESDPGQTLETWAEEHNLTYYFEFLYHNQKHHNLKLFSNLKAIADKLGDNQITMDFVKNALYTYRWDCKNNPDQHDEANNVVVYTQRISEEMQKEHPDYAPILMDMNKSYAQAQKSDRYSAYLFVGSAVLWGLSIFGMLSIMVVPAAAIVPICATLSAMAVIAVLALLSNFIYNCNSDQAMSLRFFNSSDTLLDKTKEANNIQVLMGK